MFLYSREEYDRYYRSGAEDYYRRKDEPFRDPYRDPWNGRREAEGVWTVHQTTYIILLYPCQVLNYIML